MDLEAAVSDFLQKVAGNVDLGTRQKIARGFLRFIDDVSERSHIPREAFEHASFVEGTDESGNLTIETRIAAPSRRWADSTEPGP
ncbi:MAG: hypothetical protein A3K08_01420 [Candidatus Doudnabacteria bacterium RIFCSPLOWO2_01_41_7]|uniref:Uncharacterized protein n=1 Tax=Candidatus Doudnabacteria bacterium RIFCSPHIGHO2_01_FULL_41_86 TaxID=1817821 RepID=A0A1F5N8D3_9BACT|nr:MAG: hypothetical protein A2717_00220 [Candidatus Doudnabacteria bacterium RIFCSPHIGHO2_01_FULL_41_86]OGE94280.1 MAG: hypothetical protein A3K08_01420 [Candidatus Doudnabacteria bacterium RIFCSPLOWO2_01_41_7]OGE98988.1 MAG: hypothetical protein A3G89_02985 [Candidatus Doudnabacteria bacterium RIFCSPLOWO2_12_FULL_42_9]